jgi:hypothetical protein
VKTLLSIKNDFGHIIFSGIPEGEFLMVLYVPTFEVIVERLTISKGISTRLIVYDLLKVYVKIGRWEWGSVFDDGN